MNLKRILSVILAIILSFGACTVAFAENQTTVPEGYVGIYTAEDLNNIRNNLSGKYILMNDIDLSVYENWEPIGTISTPFTGELDGNGYYIKNLKIQKTLSDSENNIGLFGVAKECLFDKLIIENGLISVLSQESIDSSKQKVIIGMIVAKIWSEDGCRIRNCSAIGKIDVSGGSSIIVGGLVGEGINDNVILSSSNYVDINVTTQNCKQKIYVGGILGKASADQNSYSESILFITKTANYGNISINNKVCSKETEIFVGGIYGIQISGNEISYSYNRGDISTASPLGRLVIGGIVGEAIWRVEQCYNTGKVNIVADENNIANSICFIKMPNLYLPTAPVFPQDFTVYNCYALNADTPLCSQNSDDSIVLHKNIYSLSQDEFCNHSSFTGFDFENVWEMEENGYPVLKNQPKITIKEIIELDKGDVYLLKYGKISIPTDSSVITVNDNEVTALHEGKTNIIVTHEYNHETEYTIIVSEKTNPSHPKILSYILLSLSKIINTIVQFVLRTINVLRFWEE